MYTKDWISRYDAVMFPLSTPPLIRRIQRHLRRYITVQRSMSRIDPLDIVTGAKVVCQTQHSHMGSILLGGKDRILRRTEWGWKPGNVPPYDPLGYARSAVESNNLKIIRWAAFRIGRSEVLNELLRCNALEWIDELLRYRNVSFDAFSVETFVDSGNPKSLHWALRNGYVPNLKMTEDILAWINTYYVGDERWDEVRGFLQDLRNVLIRLP